MMMMMMAFVSNANCGPCQKTIPNSTSYNMHTKVGWVIAKPEKKNERMGINQNVWNGCFRVSQDFIVVDLQMGLELIGPPTTQKSKTKMSNWLSM